MAGNIAEALAAGLIFAAIPEKLGAKLCDIRIRDEEKYGERVKKRLLAKLAGMATAYSELAKNVSENENVEKAPEKFNPFRDSYRFVCRECESKISCWKENPEQTHAALSRAQLPALARGRAEPGDFGVEFNIRCKNIRTFCAYATNSIRRHREEKRRLAEKKESKKLISKQYEQLSEILDISAEELSEDMLFEKETEAKVKRAMAEMNIRCEALVYRDKSDMLHLELCGEDIADLSCNIESLTGVLSEIVGCRLSRPEQISEQRHLLLSFVQTRNLVVKSALARKKQSEKISGDCGTYFVGKDGCTYIILCDGMGSGQQAHKEAQNALKLLESFLKAGIDAQYAANIVKSALEVKADESKYATIDITVINPVKSEALIIKCGAPPTYIRRKVAAGEYAVMAVEADIPGSCAPLGEAFVKTVKLSRGDMIIMASDGADISGENKIKNILKKINSDEPRELSDILLKTVKTENQSDDRTIIAILYEKVLQEV